MKLPIITDTHWGVRNDNRTFYPYMKKFLNEVFFPYIDKHNIKRIVHGGDLVDRRRYINFVTAHKLRQDFLFPLLKRGVTLDIIVGNHDVYYKNTLAVSVFKELAIDRFKNVNVYTKATEVDFEGTKVLFVPWICDENREHALEMINTSKAKICIGHLDINGFELRKGIVQHAGMDKNLFNNFDLCCSGHFHRNQCDGNVHYLGSPFHFDWGDYGNVGGFNVLDTETASLQLIENPFDLFHKVWYNDKDKTTEEVLNYDFAHCKGCFVKVIVEDKTNPYLFDLFIEKLEENDPVDLKVVEDHMNLDELTEEDILEDIEDTLSFFHTAIDQYSNDINKKALSQTIDTLYIEARDMQ